MKKKLDLNLFLIYYGLTIAGHRQFCCVVCDNRESGVNPEQTCCRNDRVFSSAKAATGVILGRFEKAAMSKSEDLPVKWTANGSCQLQSFTRYEDFVCSSVGSAA